MRCVDSGVVVAAFASWHEAHEVARAEVSRGPGIAGHALLEAYSVLTRLPAPHRAPAQVVATFLDRVIGEECLALTGPGYRRFVIDDLPSAHLTGGSAYDALIAATVREVDGTLVTLDRRALATYRLMGCDALLLQARPEGKRGS